MKGTERLPRATYISDDVQCVAGHKERYRLSSTLYSYIDLVGLLYVDAMFMALYFGDASFTSILGR